MKLLVLGLLLGLFLSIFVFLRVPSPQQAAWFSHGFKCNIEKFDAMPEDIFFSKFSKKKPFIIRNPNKKFQEMCKLSNLLATFGNTSITVSSSNTHSHSQISMLFEDYVLYHIREITSNDDAMKTWYFFGDQGWEWNSFLKQYSLPPNSPEPSLAFGLGGHHSGVPLHVHGPGYSEVLIGLKRWFIFPASIRPRFDPKRSALQWFEEIYPTLTEEDNLFECTIGPDEAIYFPDNFFHATLNIGELTTFVSTFTTEWKIIQNKPKKSKRHDDGYTPL
jgi:hypothetical protein